MGIPDHLTHLLRNIYAGQEATVRTVHGTTDWFQIRKGVHQSCILSPCLFAEYIMWNPGLDEAQLESRLPGEISITSYMQRRRQWHPTPVLLPGKSHGRRSLVGCSPWGRWGSDTTERLHFHFSLSCIGEGNGNPLQCSCLQNPRDGGAWWAAVYGVAQSRTRLKWLSSSSRYAYDTNLMTESEEEPKSLMMKVKEESEKLA